MKESKCDIIIIGAGLTGLTLAYLLNDKGYTIRILEAKTEPGGRIHSSKKEQLAPIELGATWFGKKHTEMSRLLADLGIQSFEQILGENAIYEPLSTSPPQLVKLPPSDEEASYRVKDGTISLIDHLVKNLNENCALHINEKAISITKNDKNTLVKTSSNEFQGDIVISTLPPYLLLKTLTFSPDLPSSVKAVMAETHTWMGESIKVGLHYKAPFWRGSDLSGTIFSNVGPIPEMYDHSDYEDSKFALKGFLNGAYYTMSKDDRLELILSQLNKYFGKQAYDLVSYEEKVWRNDPFTFSPYKTDILPHQNNGHPVFQQGISDNTFYIAGSETSAQFPGYMEGAIRSAHYIANSIRENTSKSD